MTTYNQSWSYRNKDLNYREARKQATKTYKEYADEKLEQYNSGLISADEYYELIRSAKSLFLC